MSGHGPWEGRLKLAYEDAALQPTAGDAGPAPVALAEFSGVAKTFDIDGRATAAIHDITLRVAEGEFITLVGPSGCGKSTLLNLIAGLLAPTAGTVRYRGRPVTGLNRRVGYMTQQDHLLPWRTIADNIAVPLELRGMARADRRRRVDELIGLVGLAGFDKHYPSQVSGGMRKRTALARLLASDAETVLMDEPFGALDAQLRLQLQIQMTRLCRRLGKTMMFVTHDLDEAIALADRCVVFGPRPGTILREIPVDLGRERELGRLRFDARYIELTHALWRLMAPAALDGTP